MKVLVEIAESDASFAMKVLKSLSFVKKAKPISNSSFEIFENLKASAEEVKLHKEGEIQLKSAQELIDEL